MIESFHEDMLGTVQYDGSFSDPFPVKIGVKQGFVLASTLFGIFSPFSCPTSSASQRTEYISTPEATEVPSTLPASEQRPKMLIADDAGLTAQSEEALQ